MIDRFDIVIGGGVLGYVLLVNLFAAAMHAKAIVERGDSIPFVLLLPLYVGAFVGLVLDVLFNWTAGSIVYRELPRELTFTSRCKRHKLAPWGTRDREKAEWWCKQLNKFDPGHC